MAKLEAWYRFFSSLRKYKTINRYRTRFLKNCFQKVVHKASEFLENKILDAVTKSNNDNDNTEKQEPVEAIITLPEKKKNYI